MMNIYVVYVESHDPGALVSTMQLFSLSSPEQTFTLARDIFICWSRRSADAIHYEFININNGSFPCRCAVCRALILCI